MNKIWLIASREIKNRVQKKSFLLATILIPLIFPVIIGLLAYLSYQQEKGQAKETILFVDENNFFLPDTTEFHFVKLDLPVEKAKIVFQEGTNLGLLHFPKLDFMNPKNITFRTKRNLSPEDEGHIKWMVNDRIKQVKMGLLDIQYETLNKLNNEAPVDFFTISSTGKETSSHAGKLFGVGMFFGILMYTFIMIYGAQIMQGVIEEKTSKVVEVIVSSVKPFQLMMGKILGLATVGLLQFFIWIVLISTLTSVTLGIVGVEMGVGGVPSQVQSGTTLSMVFSFVEEIPIIYLISIFLFYFLGGYLVYGALFAAVGSSVDSPAEAQQFMFPITIPLLISYLSLFLFVLRDPNSSASFWLSIIPFTSPIAMMGRAAFMPPEWEIVLSMILLVGGFVLTTWVAGRIYRVGILMHGTKVNFKILVKWFLMKN